MLWMHAAFVEGDFSRGLNDPEAIYEVAARLLTKDRAGAHPKLVYKPIDGLKVLWHAVIAGSRRAKYSMASIMRTGAYDTDVNMARSDELLTEAANGRLAIAAYVKAIRIRESGGSHQLAIEYHRIAAAQGYTDAKFALAYQLILANQFGSEARTCLVEAAELGHAAAKVTLAWLDTIKISRFNMSNAKTEEWLQTIARYMADAEDPSTIVFPKSTTS
jgi:hypothetical protein